VGLPTSKQPPAQLVGAPHDERIRQQKQHVLGESAAVPIRLCSAGTHTNKPPNTTTPAIATIRYELVNTPIDRSDSRRVRTANAVPI
jgi:hypothetical protein